MQLVHPKKKQKIASILIAALLLFSLVSQGQVRYYFNNTSDVNDESYNDDEIYLNFQLMSNNTAPAGAAATYDINTNGLRVIQGTPNTLQGPDGAYYQDINIRLDELPIDPANGERYIDMPPVFGSRLYVGFGAPVYRDQGNPLLDNPGNPNYGTKIETIEFTINENGSIFTNTSRVDRYAYPMGEELYCGGQLDSKVGETVTHEQVVAKWKLFANDDFQHSYDPVRDIITQMGHTSYFHEGNPGNDYYEDFFDALWAYASTNPMTAFFDGQNHTITATGNTLYIGGVPFDRNAMDLEDISGGGGQFIGDRIRMAFGVSINRGVILLTQDVQNWEDPAGYWQNPVKNDYTNFFHSDFVSYDSKTYALAFDDVFDQSSTQACNNPDYVSVLLGGFGTEHTQVLTDVYITPLDLAVDQYSTLQLTANGLDQGQIDMDIPADAVVTWTVTDPNGSPVNDLIDENGSFGPTDITGEYQVTLNVQTAQGDVFTATEPLTVNDAGTTAQVCRDAINGNMDYSLEVIGTSVYLTLIPGPTWNNAPGNNTLFYGPEPILNQMGANAIIPNQAFPLEGMFFGDEVYFQIATQNNGGSPGFIHIPNLGTCDGLPVEEVIVQLDVATDVTIDVTDTYQIDVSGITNLDNVVPYPDDLFTSALIFSGDGVDANGLFTPTDAGEYVLSVEYDGIVTEMTIVVTGGVCTSTIDLGGNQIVCENVALNLALPTNDTYTNILWSGDGSVYLDDLTTATPEFTGTLTGTFDLEVTAEDGSGCNASGSMQVEVNGFPTVTLTEVGPLCEGQDVEVLTAEVLPAGGTGTWANAATLSDTQAEFDPTTIGSFEIDYSYDVAGCVTAAAQTIEVSAAPEVTLAPIPNVCVGSAPVTVEATVNVEGGLGVWGNAVEITEITAEFDPTTEGDFDVSITYSIGGCEASATKTITVEQGPQVTLSALDPMCVGAPNVDITATVSPTGGAGTWTNATKLTETTAEFSPQNAGEIEVDFVYSTGGCEASASQTVTVEQGATASISNIGPFCAGDLAAVVNATVEPAGGTGVWTNVNTIDATTAEFEPTTAGTVEVEYNYEVNGCSASAVQTVTVLGLPTITLPEIGPLCVGSAPVSIVATVSDEGGTSAWTNATEITETTAEFNPITEGDFVISMEYTLDGCQAEASQTVAVQDGPAITLTQLPAMCAGGAPVEIVANVTPGGGTGIWTNATELTETTAEFDPAAAGTFVVEYAYSNGTCAATASQSVVVQTGPEIDLPTIESICAGSETVVIEATVAPGGGVGYWTNATAVGATSAAFNPTNAGSFEIEFTYQVDGCESVTTENITVLEVPTVTLPEFEPVCVQSAPVLIEPIEPLTGGTGTWSNATKVTETSAEFAPLTVGEFDIEHTYDLAGCQATGTTAITVLTQPTATLGAVGQICAGDPAITLEADVTPAGGVGTWTSATKITETTGQFDPAAAGTFDLEYRYEVAGCEAVVTQPIIVGVIPTVLLAQIELPCNTQAPVLIQAGVSPEGGTGTWENATKVSETSAELIPVPGRNFDISYVYELNGCETSIAQSVVADPMPEVELSLVDLLCEGDEAVTITATVSPTGGTGSWDGAVALNDSSAVFLPASPGVNSVGYTYVHAGCEVTVTTAIEVEEFPIVSLPAYREMKEGAEPGLLVAEATPAGGIGTWVNADKIDETSASFNPYLRGDYEVTYTYATEACGEVSASGIVEVNGSVLTAVPNSFSPNGDGLNDVWEVPFLRDIRKVEIYIYDRWGEVVFTEQGDYIGSWDGTNKGNPVPQGVYSYLIQSRDQDGVYEYGKLSVLR